MSRRHRSHGRPRRQPVPASVDVAEATASDVAPGSDPAAHRHPHADHDHHHPHPHAHVHAVAGLAPARTADPAAAHWSLLRLGLGVRLGIAAAGVAGIWALILGVLS